MPGVIPPDQLENAVDEQIRNLRRQIENFQRSDIQEEVLAQIQANEARGVISDLRSIQNKYPSSPSIKSDIFQISPNNISSYASYNRRKDLITGEANNQLRQYIAINTQIDPIRFYFRFGQEVPGDAGANYYRSRVLGIDQTPAPFNTVTTRFDYTGSAPWTYEPEGSVNIIWDLGGARTRRDGGNRIRVWDNTDSTPNRYTYQDSALQWALAVNEGSVGDEVSPVQDASKAWDIFDPQKKPLRKQLVFRNRFQSADPQGSNRNIFNMATAMITLARLSSPESTAEGILSDEMVTFLRNERDGLVGRDNIVKRMLTLAEIPGNENTLAKEQYVTNLGSVEVEAGRSVDFSVTDQNATGLEALRSVNCSIYDVYLLARATAANRDNPRERIFRMQFELNLIYVDQVFDREVDPEGTLYMGIRNRDPRYYYRDALNSYVDFNFYDFAVQNVWARDRFTDMLDKAPGELLLPPPRNEQNRQVRGRTRLNRVAGGLIDTFGAYVNPEYSYYNGSYEAASQQMPEALLPNMYIYQLATGNQNDIPVTDSFRDPNVLRFLDSGERGGLQQQSFVDEENQRQTRYYDKLITLDQFENFTLPALGGSDNEEEERAAFQEYLNSYAEAVKGSNITIDFTSQLNDTVYNLATPRDELDMYDNFYRMRTYFPMYVEVGIPCYNTLGPIGDSLLSLDNPETDYRDFDFGFKSSGLINSILRAPSIDRTFTMYSSGLVASGYDKNESFSVTKDRDRLSRAEDFGARLVKTKRPRTSLKVYDFDSWLDSVAQITQLTGNELRQAQQGQFTRISFRGPLNDEDNINPVQTNRLLDFLEDVKENAERVCEENMVRYQDLVLTRERLVAETETIIYKLIKKDFATGEILQNYFFPASEQSRMIKFVDTQIKYGKKYLYELHGFDIVYGSKFRFRNRWAIYPESANVERDQQIPIDNYRDQRVSFSFNVETIPNLKVIEYPIYSSFNTVALAAFAGVSRFQDLFRQLERGQMGGVSYPIASVYDRPPMAPQVSILPFQGDKNKILFNFSPSVGELVRDKTIPYISLSDSDEARFREISDIQRSVENFTLPPGHVEFRSEGPEEIRKVEIFRTMELDMNVPTNRDLYRSFENKLYKTLDITLDPDDPSGNYARSFDFIDDIQPNVNYYYTFRIGDVHGNVSNPTEIYRVKIDSLEAGSFYAIEEVVLKSKPLTKPSKEMNRYLEIQASDIQSLPYVSAAEGDITTSLRSLVDFDSENKVENNKFLIRITSKDTGRKIDIKTSFTVKEHRE